MPACEYERVRSLWVFMRRCEVAASVRLRVDMPGPLAVRAGEVVLGLVVVCVERLICIVLLSGVTNDDK
jgi:hypothetical protein